MMRKWMFIWLMLVLCLGTAGAQDEDDEFGWTVVDVQFAMDITEDAPRQARLSPDGSMIAYDDEDGICIYTFATEESTCAAFPEATPGGEPVRLHGHEAYQWSPDSTQIAFTEEAFRSARDSDIWLYDVVETKFTALTNDEFSGSFLRGTEDVGVIEIDLLPTWSANGDLYFIRTTYESSADNRPTALYRIPRTGGAMLGGVVDAGEPALDVEALELVVTFDPAYVLSFFNIQSNYAFNGVTALSPDSNTLALISRPQRFEEGELLLVDLTSGEITTIATYEDIIAPQFFPEWVEHVRDQGFLPDGIAWTAQGYVVVNTANFQFANSLYATLVSVDPSDGTVSGVLDHSAVPSRQEYMTSADYEHPAMAVMSPDGEHVLYFNFASFIPQITLSVVSIDDGDPQVLYEFDEDEYDNVPMYFASAGTDGDTLRVAMMGYVFTLERTN